MTVRSNIILCCFSFAIISGCAKPASEEGVTTYKPQTGSVESPGYTDKKLGETSYRIEIFATPQTSREAMREMGYRRASEIAIENGYPYFAVTYAMDMTQVKTNAVNGILLEERSKPLFRLSIDLYATQEQTSADGRTLFLANAREILNTYETE